MSVIWVKLRCFHILCNELSDFSVDEKLTGMNGGMAERCPLRGVTKHCEVALDAGERTDQIEKGSLSESAGTTEAWLPARTHPAQVSAQGRRADEGLGLPGRAEGEMVGRRFQIVYWDYPHPTPHPSSPPRTPHSQGLLLNFLSSV